MKWRSIVQQKKEAAAKKARPPRRKRSIAELVSIMGALANAPDDFPMDLEITCVFFGGSRPIDPATLYRRVKEGRVPPPDKAGPNSSRWTLGKCRDAKVRMIGEIADRAWNEEAA
jgi:hypothetical protein